jgi:hypothetical protein
VLPSWHYSHSRQAASLPSKPIGPDPGAQNIACRLARHSMHVHPTSQKPPGQNEQYSNHDTYAGQPGVPFVKCACPSEPINSQSSVTGAGTATCCVEHIALCQLAQSDQHLVTAHSQLTGAGHNSNKSQRPRRATGQQKKLAQGTVLCM